MQRASVSPSRSCRVPELVGLTMGAGVAMHLLMLRSSSCTSSCRLQPCRWGFTYNSNITKRVMDSATQMQRDTAPNNEMSGIKNAKTDM
jgi:hypothetical protein